MPLTNTQGGAGRSLSLYNGTVGIAFNVKYTPGGAVCFMNSGWGNSFTERYTFNNRLQPVAMQVYGTGYGTSPAPPPCAASTDTAGTQLNLAYNFVDASGHNNGNVVSIANNVYTPRSQSFTYDSLNRLKTAQTTSTYATNAANCWAETYSYDPWGNLTKLGADTTNQSAYVGCTQESGFDFSAPGLIGTNNRIATTGYVYDAAGNLTTSPGAGTVTFDAENHMVSAGGQSYAYDGDGNRIWKAPTASPNSPTLIYWYGGSGNLLQESDGAGNGQYSHIYFNGRRIKRVEWLHGGWFDHYAYDHLGNARWVYGYNGAWDLSEYYPFGGERAISSGEGNKFKFTGKERDSESGLDNSVARFFGPILGRFVSPDPENAGGSSDDPQSWNAYSYVENNPLNDIDPDGMACVQQHKADGSTVWVDDGGPGQSCADAAKPMRARLTLLILASFGAPIVYDGPPRILKGIGDAVNRTVQTAADFWRIQPPPGCVAAATLAGAGAGAVRGAAAGPAIQGLLVPVTAGGSELLGGPPGGALIGGLLGGAGGAIGGNVVGQVACRVAAGGGGNSGGGGRATGSSARLTRSQQRQTAEYLGMKEVKGMTSQGQPVFEKDGRYFTFSNTGHTAGEVFKELDRNGNRIATTDLDFNRIGK